jgi:hypothetical protein
MLPGPPHPGGGFGAWLLDTWGWIYSLEGLIALSVIAGLIMAVLAILFPYSAQITQ